MTSVPMSGHDGPYDAPIRISELIVLPDWIDFNGHMNAAYYGLTFQAEAEKFLQNVVGFGWGFAEREGAGKRMHMFFEMISDRTGKLSATAEYVNMNVNQAERRGQDFPDWLQVRLADMQAAHDTLDRPKQAGAPIGLRRK